MVSLAVFPKGFFDALVSGRMSLEEWLDLAATLDVDGVELYPAFFRKDDEEYVGRIGERIRSLGLAMPMLCHSPDFTQRDPSLREKEVEILRRRVDMTAQLGGKYCRVLSGQRRPDVEEEEGINWVVSCIEQAIPHAEVAGVVLVLENHYKDGMWTLPEFAQSKERFLRILRALPSPWLKVQYDPSNAVVAGDDPYELLEAVLDRVATVHASDRYLEGGTLADLRRMDADPQHGYARILKHGVIGEGLNDYDRILGTLARAGFSGWISIEDGEGPTIAEGMENLRRSVAFLRGKIAEHFPRDTEERLF